MAGRYDCSVLVSVGLGSAVYYAIKTLVSARARTEILPDLPVDNLAGGRWKKRARCTRRAALSIWLLADDEPTIRTRRRQRDRITKAATVWAERQAQRKRVIGDEESAEWINTVLYRFWQFYEPGRCGLARPFLVLRCGGAV